FYSSLIPLSVTLATQSLFFFSLPLLFPSFHLSLSLSLPLSFSPSLSFHLSSGPLLWHVQQWRCEDKTGDEGVCVCVCVCVYVCVFVWVFVVVCVSTRCPWYLYVCYTSLTFPVNGLSLSEVCVISVDVCACCSASVS